MGRFWTRVDFDSIPVCIGLVLRKSKSASKKVSLNHLKFCTESFCDTWEMLKKAKNPKVVVFIRTLTYIHLCWKKYLSKIFFIPKYFTFTKHLQVIALLKSCLVLCKKYIIFFKTRYVAKKKLKASISNFININCSRKFYI